MPLQLDPTVITETDLLTLHNQHTVAEEHNVPGVGAEFLSTYTIPASGVVSLREQPKQLSATIPTGTTVVEVPGGPFVEVLSGPAAGQFQVNYSNGNVTFNVADAGKDVLVSYTALGSVVKAEHVNNISTPLVPFYNKLDGIVPDLPAIQNFTFPADVTVTGDLNVLGVVNKLAVEVLDFTDNILLLNSGQVDDGAAITFVGIQVDRGGLNPRLVWGESDLSWNMESNAGATLFKMLNSGDATISATLQLGSTLQLGKFTDAQETTLTSGWGALESGKQWFNTDSNQFKGWNGAAVVILG